MLKSSTFNTKSIIFNTKFIVVSTKFIVCNSSTANVALPPMKYFGTSVPEYAK